jgi:hypothetical protein
MSGRGKMMLFVDADGATKFSDLDRLIAQVRDGMPVAIGSRAHLVKTHAVVKVSPPISLFWSLVSLACTSRRTRFWSHVHYLLTLHIARID